MGVPDGASGQDPPANTRDIRDVRDANLIPGVGKIPWRRKLQPTPVFLPVISHGQRIQPGYSPWGCKDSDTTEHLMWSVEMMKNESESLSSVQNSPGQTTGAGSLSLLQGILPTQRSNSGLLYCGQIFYQLSHQGSPRILEWVDYPFSNGSSQPRNQTRVSCIAGAYIFFSLYFI